MKHSRMRLRVLMLTGCVALVGGLMAGGEVIRHSTFGDRLDLVGGDYWANVSKVAGGVHVMPRDGEIETMGFKLALRVDGRDLELRQTRETAVHAGIYTGTNLVLRYAGKGARAEIEFLPRKFIVRAFVDREKPVNIREVEIGRGTRTESDTLFDPTAGVVVRHYFPLDNNRTIAQEQATPAPWMFGYSREGKRDWWTVALEPDCTPEGLSFSAFAHVPDGPRGLCWRISYPKSAPATGTLALPPLVFRYGDKDYFAALQRHVDDLRDEKKIVNPIRDLPLWHGGTIACSWRYQSKEPRREQATQANMEAYVKMLDDNGIDFRTLIVDDFWGAKRGIWEPDPKKWPDMRGFIDKMHAKGRKVLLWVCVLTEGLPKEECLGSVWNIESEALRKRIHDYAHKMLSPDSGCYNADGIKFDFTQNLPGDYGKLKYRGNAYQLERYRLLSEAMRAAKPDCILDYQTVNPYFVHTATMIRLNDYFGAPENGWRELSTRARIASICGLGAYLDTDHAGWSQFSYAGGYEYFRRQGELGVRALYLGPQDMKNVELMKIVRAWPREPTVGRDYDPRAYGAKGDGVTKDTAAIQKAIDAAAAAGGGRVVLKGGTFLSGTITLKSAVGLHIEEDGVLLGSPDCADYPERKELKHVIPENCPRGRNACFIYADEAENISITGKGKIDCNGKHFVNPRKGARPGDRWRFVRKPGLPTPPRVVFFAGCRNVLVEDVSMVNGPAGWGYWIHDCDHVHFNRANVKSSVEYPNNDGIDIHSSRDVLVENCDIECGDDCLVLRAQNRMMHEDHACERMHVRNCRLRTHCAAIRIAYTNDGTMRDSLFENLDIRDSWMGIELEMPEHIHPTDYGREATLVERLAFRNITMKNTRRLFFFNLPKNPAVKLNAIRDFIFENVNGDGGEAIFVGRESTPLENFVFRNCSFKIAKPAVMKNCVGFDCPKGTFAERRGE